MQVVALGFYNPAKHDNKVPMILYMANSSYCETHVTNWSPFSFATYFNLENIGWLAHNIKCNQAWACSPNEVYVPPAYKWVCVWHLKHIGCPLWVWGE